MIQVYVTSFAYLDLNS